MTGKGAFCHVRVSRHWLSGDGRVRIFTMVRDPAARLKRQVTLACSSILWSERLSESSATKASNPARIPSMAIFCGTLALPRGR